MRNRFFVINRQGHTTKRAITEVTAFRLLEQNFIFQLSRSLLAFLLVLFSMILLTFDAAIFHKIASSAYL